MKRIISFICIFAMAFSAVSSLQTVALAADSYDVDADTIVLEGVEYVKSGYRMAKLDFEDGDVGSAIYNGVSSEYVFDFTEISETEDTENHGMVVCRPWAKTRTEFISLRTYNDGSTVKGSNDLFVLDYDIYFDEMYNGSAFSFKTFSEDGTSAWNSDFASLKFDGGYLVLNDTYAKEIATDRWYNFTLIFDFYKKEITIAVDGKAFAVGVAMGDTTVKGICSIEYNPYNAGSNYENIYMDNIVAYRYVTKNTNTMGGMEYAAVNSYDMPDMSILLEAEDMVSGTNMTLIEDSNASGGYAMKFIGSRTPTIGNVAEAADFQVKPNPDLMVNINIPTTTTYKIWVRIKNATAEAQNSPVWLRLDESGKYIGKTYYPFPSVNQSAEEKNYLQYPHNYRLKFLNTQYTNSTFDDSRTKGVTTEYNWVLLNNAGEHVSLGSGENFRHANEPSYVLKNGNRELALLFGDTGTVVDSIYIAAINTLDSTDSTYSWKPSGTTPSIIASGLTPHNIFPTTKVPAMELAGVHPRLFITEDEIPAFKEKLKLPLYESTYNSFKTLASQDINGLLPANNTCYSNNTAIGSALQARAFMYLIGEVDAAHARKTVDELKNLLATVTFDIPNDTTYNTRNMGTVMVTSSMVYDWCYDVMNYSDREFIIRRLKEIAADTEVGWPPVRRGLLSSHPQEELIYLHDAIVGIAVYDEDPQWYDITMSVIYERMRDIRIFGAQSGYDYSVGSYFEARNRGSLYLDKMLHVTGGLDDGETVFGNNYPNTFMHLIYRGLPNGVWFKDGDDYHWDGYNGYNKIIDTNVITAYIGDQYNNPYLLEEALQGYVWDSGNMSVMETLMFDPTADTAFMSELPTAYMTTYPMTTMVARTGWNQGMNSPDAMVYMNMHDIYMDGHQHGDVGSFQLYYKGMLALDSGFYEYCDHYYHYQSRSIAHNVLLVDNGNPDFYQTNSHSNYNSTNDGGQKNPNLVSKTTYDSYMNNLNQVDENGNITKYGEFQQAYEKAHYIGPNKQTPAFSYLSSDISGAYNYQTAKTGQTEPEKKIADSGYERSMVFMDLYDEEFPAVLVVYDNVTSLDADYKKTWLLHSQLEPVVDGSETTIIRTENGQNGKLVNTTMYPKADNANIEIIGGEGKEFWVGGQNWPYVTDMSSKQVDDGAYRIELSPKTAATDDIFLNAMYVTDADNANTLPMNMIEDDEYVGVSVKDRVVTFSKTRDNIASEIKLTIPDNGHETTYCLLTDMAAGKWKVSGNGNTLYVESKGDSNLADHAKDGEYTLAFSAAPGTYTIAPTTDINDASILTMPTAEIKQYGDFRIRNNANLMYLPKPNKLVDGDGDGVSDTYSAIDGVFTQIGANITNVMDNTVTFTFTETNGTVNTYELTAGTTQYKKNGSVVTNIGRQIKRPPMMINGEMYADLRDFYYILGYTSAASYSETAKLLHVHTNYEGGQLK